MKISEREDCLSFRVIYNPSMSWILYDYKNCDSCRKARKWLEAREVAFERRPIRETPPSTDELNQMLGHLDNELRRLFNTSGGDYRSGNYKDRLPDMSPDEAIAELAKNGNLIKRPFLIGPDAGTVGFKEEAWSALFNQSRKTTQ